MRQRKYHNGLQIHQDLEFQRRSWRMQRIGWVVMALFILAGLLGLFGSGWLGHATIATADRALQLLPFRSKTIDLLRRKVGVRHKKLTADG